MNNPKNAFWRQLLVPPHPNWLLIVLGLLAKKDLHDNNHNNSATLQPVKREDIS